MQRQDVVQGAVEAAAEAGFVAMEEVKPGSGSQGAEGVGHGGDGIAGRLLGDGLVEGAGFHGPDAAEAPGGGAHFLDQAELDAVAGDEAAQVVGHGFGEALGGLAIEQDASGEQAMADGVLGGALFPFGGDGALGAGAVGARGSDTTFG